MFNIFTVKPRIEAESRVYAGPRIEAWGWAGDELKHCLHPRKCVAMVLKERFWPPSFAYLGDMKQNIAHVSLL